MMRFSRNSKSLQRHLLRGSHRPIKNIEKSVITETTDHPKKRWGAIQETITAHRRTYSQMDLVTTMQHTRMESETQSNLWTTLQDKKDRIIKTTITTDSLQAETGI